MMRKARHQVGFLEADGDKLLLSSRCNGDPLYEHRITLMQADA
jgi:hypothetical protein